MDTANIISTLRDPLGLPFHPAVFQVLMVLTFAIHILFVNLTIGSSLLSVYGFFGKEKFRNQLSRSLVRATTASTSLAILFGVAPLLFVQVLYDPFWYSSNLLSAAWVIGFILVVMAAYGLTYVFYLRRRPQSPAQFAVYGLTAFVLFILAGMIMHSLNYQLLLPDKWLDWYTRSGQPDTTGLSLHALSLPRLFHFIVPSFALTGIFLMLYAWYFRDRVDMDSAYLKRAGSFGARLAFFFTLVQVIMGLWWLFSLPGELQFYKNHVLLFAATLGLAFLVLLHVARKDPVRYALPSAISAFLVIFGMAYAREVLRMKYVGRFAYSSFTYPMNIDWASTALFLLSFVLGLSVIGYLATIAFRAGRTSGTYQGSAAMTAWGRVNLGALVLWVISFLSLGVFITMRN